MIVIDKETRVCNYIVETTQDSNSWTNLSTLLILIIIESACETDIDGFSMGMLFCQILQKKLSSKFVYDNPWGPKQP